MARVRVLLPYQWRAYWRGIRTRGVVAGANLAMAILLAALMLPVHIGICVSAAIGLRRDPGGYAAVLTELAFLGILAAWIFIPLLVSSVQARGRGIVPGRLLHFPFSTRQLFLAGVSGALVQPLYWILIAASLFSLLPAACAPNPLAGTVAALLFLLASAFLSWTIGLVGEALLTTRRARELALVVISFLFVGFVLLARAEFEAGDEGFWLHGLGEPILLANRAGSEGLLVHVRNWTPAAWVLRAAMGQGPVLAIGLLALFASLSFALSLRSFARALSHPVLGLGGAGKRRRAIGTLPALPAPVGAATRKELRYLTRTLDTILSVALSLGMAGYLVVAGTPRILVLLLGIPLIIINEAAMPLNAFGLDRRGVDRYRLLPLSGTQVLLSKNLAYILLVTAQVLPALIAGALRFGPAVGAAAILATFSFSILAVLLGNVVSVRVPAPREFFNFENREQTGGLLPLLYMSCIWMVPAGLAMAARLAGDLALVLGQLVLLGICALAYRALLPRAGRRFDQSAEIMRKRLAA